MYTYTRLFAKNGWFSDFLNNHNYMIRTQKEAEIGLLNHCLLQFTKKMFNAIWIYPCTVCQFFFQVRKLPKVSESVFRHILELFWCFLRSKNIFVHFFILKIPLNHWFSYFFLENHWFDLNHWFRVIYYIKWFRDLVI